MMRRTKILTLSLVAALGAACSSSEDPYPTTGPGTTTATGDQPTFDKVQNQDKAPPPISGGTLSVSGNIAVAADPDRDRIYVINLSNKGVEHDIKLADGSEPGRVAFDGKGHAHIAERSSGNVATVDLATGALTERKVCAAPRGLAYDDALDAMRVACADGWLVTMPLDASKPLDKIVADVDVRDIIINKTTILLSRFRKADVVVLDRASGLVQSKTHTDSGNLAWRMIAAPKQSTAVGDATDETPAIIAQDPTNPIGTVAQGYYGTPALDSCSAPTITSTRLDLPGRDPILIPPAVLPVDIATPRDGHEYTIIAAGNGHTPNLPQVFVRNASEPTSGTNFGSTSAGARRPLGAGVTNPDCQGLRRGYVPGQAIAAAYDDNNDLWVQSREPAMLYKMSPDRSSVAFQLQLSTESREDTGHAIFHSNSGGFLACASCHAEGGEDGRTWTFLEGQRRTPSMLGTIRTNGPFHWAGDITDLKNLSQFVFTTRMSGPDLPDGHIDTLKAWLFKMPAPPKLEKDPTVVERGSRVFQERCSSCHSGASLTDHTTKDVGTGGTFKVPSLVGLRWRAPFLHNGCATTVKDRLTSKDCGGDQHGDLAGLAAGDINDLSDYLESL